METKLSALQAFNAMTLYLDKYYFANPSDDLGSLLGGFQLFEEGGTWDPAAWHDWINSINRVLNKKNEIKDTFTILQAFQIMTSFLEKYYELTSYDDIAAILSPLIIFEKNQDFDSIVWKDWVECVNKVLYENYQNIGRFKI